MRADVTRPLSRRKRVLWTPPLPLGEARLRAKVPTALDSEQADTLPPLRV